jgi:hypothetical protein
MKSRIVLACLLVATLHPACAQEPVPAATGCAAFHWNVAHELTVMRATAIPVNAQEKDGKSAAPLLPDKHYVVNLPPQGEAHFAVPPAREARDPAPHGGSLRFAVPAAGRYRISITSAHWIDVIANGKSIDSLDHEGHADCELLHKVVEFELPAGQALVMQLSGRAESQVGLAITRLSPGE